MSDLVEAVSQEPQEVGLVQRRPLLTKQFIPNQDFQQAYTLNESINPEGILEPQEEIQEQAVHLEDSFESIENSEEAYISGTSGNVANNFSNNLYNRNIKRNISKRGNLSKRKKKSIKRVVPPKSPCSLLNDIMKTHYHIEEIHYKKKLEWKATLLIDDFEYIGFGPSKTAAKNAAAQLALKCIYDKIPHLQTMNNDIYHLISSWNYILHNYTLDQLQLNQPMSTDNHNEKIYQSLEKMDPIMLITKSMNATFEEVPKGSNPKNITFLFKCNVGQDSFFGIGHSKKVAKKMAAYEACNKLMGIQYSKRIYVSYP